MFLKAKKKVQVFLSRVTSGYDSTKESDNRKSISKKIQSQDTITARNQTSNLLYANAMDLYRNTTIANFIVNKHCDYVASFTFIPNTGNEQADKVLEEFMQWWQKPNNCDVTGRSKFSKLTRMIQQSRTLGGDMLNQFNEGRIQQFQSSSIGTPVDNKDNKFENGLNIDKKTGRIKSYAIIDGQGNLIKQVKAENAVFVPYTFRPQQYRGVSPLTSGLDSIRDVADAQQYALMKIKIAQLFGLVVKEDGAKALTTKSALTGTSGQASVCSTNKNDDLDISKSFVMHVKSNEDVKFIESASPATATQQFMKSTIQLAMKSLGIPFSFWSQDFTNFYGSRAALQGYVRSCQPKREELQVALNDITDKAIEYFIEKGVIVMPKDNNGKVIQPKYYWQPKGVPFFSVDRQAKGYAQMIDGGLVDPEAIVAETGVSIYENLRAKKRVEDYAKKIGTTVSYNVKQEQINIDQKDNNVE